MNPLDPSHPENSDVCDRTLIAGDLISIKVLDGHDLFYRLAADVWVFRCIPPPDNQAKCWMYLKTEPPTKKNVMVNNNRSLLYFWASEISAIIIVDLEDFFESCILKKVV